MIKQARQWMMAAIFIICGTCSLHAQTEGSTVRALPKVCIDNLEGTLSKEEPVEATITISYSNEATAQKHEDSYRCLVKYRGATSIHFDKKSMRITFLEDKGDGKRDVDLPGLGRTDNSCILDAAAVDRPMT